MTKETVSKNKSNTLPDNKVPPPTKIEKATNIKKPSVTLIPAESVDIANMEHSTQLEILTNLVKGKRFMNIDNPYDALAAIFKAKGLGIDWANAIDHFYKIGDKIGVDFHILNALILRPGLNITWEIIKDAEIVYDYKLKVDNKLAIISDIHDLPSDYIEIKPYHSQSDLIKLKNEGKTLVEKTPQVLLNYTSNKIKRSYINKETIIKFKRLIKVGDTTKEIQSIGKFSNKDAVIAELIYNKAGNLALDKPWFKYNNNQLYIRAFTLGARRIGDDALLGLYETSELLDGNKVDYHSVSSDAIVID